MSTIAACGCAVLGALAGTGAPWLVGHYTTPAATTRRGEQSGEQSAPPNRPQPDGHGPARRRAAHAWAYPPVTAATFAALAWRTPTGRPGQVLLLAAWLTLAAAGTALAGIDITVHRLPRPVTAATAAIVAALITAAAATSHQPGLLGRAVLAAAGYALAYLVIAVAGPGLVGAGDVYLAGLLGLLLGTEPATGITLGALAPYLIAAPILAVRLALGRIQRGSHIAWGAVPARRSHHRPTTHRRNHRLTPPTSDTGTGRAQRQPTPPHATPGTDPRIRHPARFHSGPTRHRQRSTTGAPQPHMVEDRGTCRETIKAVTGVSAGHGLDLVARPKGFEPLTF